MTCYAASIWHVDSSAKIGYEITFTCCFYKPQPMRSPEEIRAGILALERANEGLLGEVIGEAEE